MGSFRERVPKGDSPENSLVQQGKPGWAEEADLGSALRRRRPTATSAGAFWSKSLPGPASAPAGPRAGSVSTRGLRARRPLPALPPGKRRRKSGSFLSTEMDFLCTSIF